MAQLFLIGLWRKNPRVLEDLGQTKYVEEVAKSDFLTDFL